MSSLSWRQQITAKDLESIRLLLIATGVFSAEEVAVAIELLQEKHQQGEASSYQFLFLEEEQQILAYTCFGEIPFTERRFDLYWIAVHPAFQNRKLGAKILAQSEQLIRAQHGKHIYIETSSRPAYQAARHFYVKQGYTEIAQLDDFYNDTDHKMMYCKRLENGKYSVKQSLEAQKVPER